MAGLTALSSAALDGRLDTVRYLLDKGADPNMHDELGEVPLHCAAKYGVPSKFSELSVYRFAVV
jgi:ankyrin repeat protein